MRKKLLKAAGVFCLFIVLCMSMSGCSGKGKEQSALPDVRMPNESDNNKDIETSKKSGGSNDTEGNSEEGVFYDGADLSGRVVDFTDTGFTITPRTVVVYEDGSSEGGVAAPGYESDETNINITYAEDVVFQIVNFSMGSQAEISREDADKSSIKKNTDVNIFGACQDEKHWIADKVVITRWQ